MFCKYCGKKVEDDARFCQSCGERLDESAPAARTTSPSPAQFAQSINFNPAQTMQKVIGFTQPYLTHWKTFMFIVFALWTVSAFPLFGDWISFDLFGYYEESLSIYDINDFYQNGIESINEDVHVYSYEEYIDMEGDIDYNEHEADAFVTLMNTYVTSFSAAFAILLVAAIYFMKQESRIVFAISIALSVALILFPLITVLFIKESLQNDLLATEMLSFTAAPYILIILNVAATALTFISKNKNDSTPPAYR